MKDHNPQIEFRLLIILANYLTFKKNSLKTKKKRDFFLHFSNFDTFYKYLNMCFIYICFSTSQLSKYDRSFLTNQQLIMVIEIENNPSDREKNKPFICTYKVTSCLLYAVPLFSLVQATHPQHCRREGPDALCIGKISKLRQCITTPSSQTHMF